MSTVQCAQKFFHNFVHFLWTKSVDKCAQMMYNVIVHKRAQEGGVDMTAGQKMRKLRGKRTRAEIATLVGVTHSSYTKYERDERIPRDSVKVRIAQVLGDTVANIFFADSVHK
jgi:DNA-binding XRE family transcriptional regulator